MPAPSENSGSKTRSILAPTGNRVGILEEQRRKKETMATKPKKVASPSPGKAVAAAAAVVRCGVSADRSLDSSSSSSFSSSSSSSSPSLSSRGSNVISAKSMGTRIVKNSNGVVGASKNVSRGAESATLNPGVPLPVKRCDWITPNSESVYTSFHDEEWGVPVHDDIKLFELLVLSQALAELSWPVILSKRPIFRKLFVEFDPASVANLDIERLLSRRAQGSRLLSEPKLRSIVENAKQFLKIQQDFSSFSNYCWRFVNHKQIRGGARHGRQVPAKTPKSELLSGDLMRRGFHCVGPTVVYSFMQAAGLANDHLVTCFRYEECARATEKGSSTKTTSEGGKDSLSDDLACSAAV